jgi:hypothetical protein
VRTHWLTIVPPFIAIAILFMAPFFFLWPLFRLGLVGIVIFSLLVLIALALAGRQYRRWRQSVLILTTARIFYAEQRGFFDRAATEAFYQNVRDVSYRIKGFWPTLAQYGSLCLQVDGAASLWEFHRLAHPENLQHLIVELRERGAALAEARGKREWWQDRLAVMNEDERYAFFNKLRQHVGEDAWRDFFRPQTLSDKASRDELFNLPRT